MISIRASFVGLRNQIAIHLVKRTIGVLALCLFVAATPSVATVYTYNNTTSASIPEITSDAACNSASALEVAFNVPDSFTVATISLGINLTHDDRGQIRAILNAPGGSSLVVLTQTGAAGTDPNDHYDIYISPLSDGAGSNPVNDGDDDPISEPYYHRLVNLNTNFYSGNSAGTWTLRICDRFTAGNLGTFNRARLVLTSAANYTPVCTTRTSFSWCPGCSPSPPAAATITAFPGAGLTAGGVTITRTNATLSDATASARNFNVVNTQTGGEFGFHVIEWNATAAQVELVRSEATFALSPAVRDLQWKLMDMDNNNWEDYVVVRGLFGGNEVPYSITQSAAPSYEIHGEMLETDTNSTPPDEFGNAFWNFDGAVSSVRSEYWAGDDFADPNQQFIGFGSGLFCAFDFGDAPSSFGTAPHVLGARSLFLGSVPPDGEATAGAGAGADADDVAAPGGAVPDDEDGITTAFIACPQNGTYSQLILASDLRTSGADGAIRGYIDWNRDGDFNDAGEQSAAATVGRANADPSVYVVAWSGVPANCGGTTSTYARFRYSTDLVAIASPTGQASDGEVEDYLIPAGTLPVTMAMVESEETGRGLSIRWTTAAESLNAGFRVWGRDSAGATRLLARAKSESPDSFGPRHYEIVVPGKVASGVVAIEIEDLSVLGGESRHYGPYAVGQAYGMEPEDVTVDWAALKEESGVFTDLDRMRAAEQNDVLLESLRGSIGAGPAAPSGTVARLLVREEGIHRVTYEDLRSAGIDLGGIPNRRISILNGGAVVPRFIQANGGNFGPGAAIEFVARPELTLASPVDVFAIEVAGRKGNEASMMGVSGGKQAAVSAVDKYENEIVYSFSSPTGDPWFEQALNSFQGPVSLTRSFDLPNLGSGPVELEVRSWGIGGWPGATPDHHVRIELNGVEIADRIFDGNSALTVTVDVTPLVNAGGNVLEFFVPGDTGYDFDYIAFDGFTVRYPRSSVALDGRFAAKNVPSGNLAIGGFRPADLVSVWRVNGSSAKRGQSVGAMAYSLGGGDVYAATGANLLRPAIVSGVAPPKSFSSADYVIVTHPLFVDSLSSLVSLEQSKGLSVDVVTVDEIYAAYSDHAASPAAIRSFFAASIAHGMRYALIAGADSSDPYDHLGVGSVSFVPTEYRRIGDVPFSPTDEGLVDVNGDGLGDAAIGRFPARTPGELEAMIGKLLDWESQVGSGRTAVFASGISDSEAAGFESLSDDFATLLPGWTPRFASADELGSAGAKAELLDAINSGSKLVSYVGHSSISRWDWTPVLYWSDVSGLTNAGAPNLVTAWGCWNSYYVEPVYESLAAHLLRRENAGAAAAIGATTLTSEGSHQALGALFFQQVNAGATRVGDAFRAAKQQLKAQGGADDAILGMTLLGDPAMSLPPAE